MTMDRETMAYHRRRGAARSVTDWMLGGLGFTMATASASFAGYMIATAPAEVTGSGSKDFKVFVAWDRRTAPAASHAPPAQAQAQAAPQPSLPQGNPAPQPLTTADAGAAARPSPPGAGVDFTPTGSLPVAGGVSDRDPNVTRAPRTTMASGTPGPLHEYRVRDVFGGHALIEHRSRLSLVQQGSILLGAGKVLAIERQGGTWIVRTAGGVIGGS